MLKRLRDALVKVWTLDSYGKTFQKYPVSYRDFDHTLKHVDKARAKLSMMTEEADHFDGMEFDKAEIEKYIADIIISTVRLAEVAPCGPIDIDKAVYKRMVTKMGVVIPEEGK